MTLRRVGVWGILFLLPSCVLEASTLVIRDSIGADTSLTDEMPGGVTAHDVLSWSTPGLVVTVPEDGKLTDARFVNFGVQKRPALLPKTISPTSTVIRWNSISGVMVLKEDLLPSMRILDSPKPEDK